MFLTLRIWAASLLFFSTVAGAQTPAHMVKCADNDPPAPLAGGKAINGAPAKKTSWPWFAALVLDGEMEKQTLAFCGGSIIAPQWVLTAGHCLHFIDKQTLRSNPAETGFEGRIKVVIGVDDLRGASPENTFEVEAFRMHEDFGTAYGKWIKDRTAARAANKPEPPEPELSGGNDIALVKLSRPWTGALALLPAAQDERIGDGPVSVAGFGTVELYERSGQTFPRLREYTLQGSRKLRAGCARLMQVTMPLVDTEKCLKRYSEPGFAPAIGAAQLCSGFEEVNQDSCNGDSGGPLVAMSAGGSPVQIGVVSWGASDCAGVRQSYGIYTRVAAYRGWIENAVGKLPGTERPRAEDFLRQALQDLKIDLPRAKGKVRIAIEGGSQVKAGQVYRFEVKSEVGGRLILFDIDAANRITQILPNKFTLSGGAARIRPGEALIAPSPDWGFTGFRADEPLGRGTLVALVVPDDFPATTFGTEANEQRTKGFTPVREPANYLMNILQQVGEKASASNAKSFAYDAADYEIVR